MQASSAATSQKLGVFILPLSLSSSDSPPFPWSQLRGLGIAAPGRQPVSVYSQVKYKLMINGDRFINCTKCEHTKQLSMHFMTIAELAMQLQRFAKKDKRPEYSSWQFRSQLQVASYTKTVWFRTPQPEFLTCFIYTHTHHRRRPNSLWCWMFDTKIRMK